MADLIQVIGPQLLKDMIINGYNEFSHNVDEINDLNVFPIPDCDTGTNMFLTYTNAVKQINSKEYKDCVNLLEDFSKGLLIGARGNSGVIFSQIFRGFSKYIKEHTKNPEVLTLDDIRYGFVNARKTAYKAVLKPIEGTILTVIREATEKTHKLKPKTIQEYFLCLSQEAEKSLALTPEKLEILKKANVVDAGGSGLTLVLCSMYKALMKERTALNPKHVPSEEPGISYPSPKSLENQNSHENALKFKKTSKEYGYCTEGIIYLKNPEKVKKEKVENDLLSSNCDSIVVVLDEDVLKFHAHTFKPGKMIDYFQKYGQFYKLKIENMTYQSETHTFVDVEAKEKVEIIKSSGQEEKTNGEMNKNAVVVVASGKNAEEVFKGVGVDHVINGGDTQNPSIESFLKAFEKVNAKEIIVFPNSSNVFLAATQAAEMFEKAKIHVVKNNNMVESYMSTMYIDKEESLGNVQNSLLQILNRISYGFITTAVKSINLDGVDVVKGNYLSMKHKKIISSNENIIECLEKLMKSFKTENIEIITCMLGSDLKKDDEKLVHDFFAANVKSEVEYISVLQPIYPIIIGVEYKSYE